MSLSDSENLATPLKEMGNGSSMTPFSLNGKDITSPGAPYPVSR